MYLKALKLHGFKSFADSTQLRFDPGVTAVVGPNGCGKSNIADAIRWVLGEQSAKALRGGKMQDVIFEGSDHRKAHNLCEVSLLLTECEKQLGSEFHEIEITRRVSRDGASDYFLNGQACRLKDIHRLFMDTGVGRTSYSVMAQGQIDQILSSKPEERRAVFEEAAGITKYKAQRREALNKLALTDQNLARVADVIGEVSRQIGSLKRQASKAMRYKRLNFRLRHLSLASNGFQFGQLQATVNELDSRVSGLRTNATERRTKLENHQAELEGKKAARSERNQRVQEAQQSVFDLRSQREQAENQANLAQIKRSGLDERVQSSRDDITELEMQLREVSAQVDTGAQDKQMQLGLLGSSDAVFQEKNRELALIEGELSKAEKELQQHKFHLLQLESTVARLRTDCSSFEVDQKTNQQRHDAVNAEIAEVQQAVAAATAAFAEIQQRVEQARADQSRAHNEVVSAQTLLQDTTKEFREAQRILQEIDRALAQKTARLKLLQQLQEKWEGFGEGAKALLSGRFDQALGGRKFSPITHGLEVKSEHAKAVEALLGSAVEAISVADLDTAQTILTRLEDEQVGSVCLSVGDLARATGQTQSDLPGGIVPAISVLNNFDPAHPAAAMLSSCYVAESLSTFLSYWRDHPEFSFLLVATPKGELVDRRGFVFGGYHKKPANSIVQREIDLRQLGKDVITDQAAHDEQRAKIELLNHKLADAEAALEQGRKDVLIASQHASTQQAEERNAERGLEEIQARLQRLEREMVSLDQSRQESIARLEKALAGLREADAAVEAQRQAIAANETRIMEVRNDRDYKKETLAQARLELADRRQKVEVLDRGISEMERRRVQLHDLLQQRRAEVDAWTEQVAELESSAEGQRARAEELSRTLAVAQESVEKIRVELVEIEKEIDAIEQGQSSLRTEAESAQSELARCEIKLAESRSRSQFIAEEVLREFQAELSSVNWKLALWHADDEPEGIKPLDLDEDDAEEGQPAPVRSRKKKETKGEATEEDLASLDRTEWEPIRAEIDALRQRLSGMGAVNLVAIEEYAELKQRYEFLKTQSDDLIKAKETLVKAIDEINQTSQKQFQVTFDQIKKNFEYTFHTLFGGGRAALELVQTDDIMESGIEIVAQPPGTKLKSITLLSGGQKTLTAVALLFALYLVKPSPFCLLDELDAPLDESNIGRFTNLLKQFTKESQFIIITHNKRTVAAATAIYGVTMEERGVSKTVSMRFNHERGEAEAVSIAAAMRPEPASV